MFKAAERWFRAKPGKIMRLSNLLMRPGRAFGLFLVPFLALALASPAGAETTSQAASAENGDTSPSAQGENAPSAEQPSAKAPASQAPSSQAPASQAPAKAEPHSAEATTEPPGKPGSQIVINIDKSRQQMSVFVDGIEKYTWPVSTGRYGYSTPSGTYTPTSMNEIWYSKQWDNSPMPHSIFFMKDGHAIHGSHEVKNLGRPVSHGCVRISPANATVLYTLVKENGMQNTKVVLDGLTPGGEAKVAEQPTSRRYGDADDGPWFGPGPGYYPQQPQRRGLFGGWFRQQPYGGPQGYYRPPAPRYYQRGY